MTKLNYLNRRSEGPKLGQIVAKDLRKRAKTSSPTSHKESPIELLLDNKHLTDEGLTDLARGLEDALHQARRDERSTMTVLKLSGNNLTCRSLYELSASIRLAQEELQEIDLSENDISVSSTEDCEQYSAFLDALRHCKALRSINLSNNNLSGSRAWEVFARAYAQQFAENHDALEQLADEIDEAGAGMTKMQNKMSAMSIERRDSAHAVHVDPCPSKVLGLPSINEFQIHNTGLTDAGALWLSFCVGRHKWIHDQLPGGPARQHPGTLQNGFVCLPNDQLTIIGSKLLRQAVTVPYDPLAQSSPAPSLSPLAGASTPEPGVSRRISAAGHHSANHHVNHRRRVSSSARDDDRSLAATEDMESTRRKLQRTLLENNDLHTVELWRAALQMLTHVRRVLPMALARPAVPALPEGPMPPVSPQSFKKADALSRTPSPYHQREKSETYASKLVVDTADMAGQPISVMCSKHIRVPQTFTHPRARHENVSVHSDSSSPQSTINRKARKAVRKAAKIMTGNDDAKEEEKEEIVGGLHLSTWVEVLRRKCDPERVLTDRHIEGILRWGRDRGTLSIEAEGLGKPEAIQIWRLLEGIGCLSYDV